MIPTASKLVINDSQSKVDTKDGGPVRFLKWLWVVYGTASQERRFNL